MNEAGINEICGFFDIRNKGISKGSLKLNITPFNHSKRQNGRIGKFDKLVKKEFKEDQEGIH